MPDSNLGYFFKILTSELEPCGRQCLVEWWSLRSTWTLTSTLTTKSSCHACENVFAPLFYVLPKWGEKGQEVATAAFLAWSIWLTKVWYLVSNILSKLRKPWVTSWNSTLQASQAFKAGAHLIWIFTNILYVWLSSAKDKRRRQTPSKSSSYYHQTNGTFSAIGDRRNSVYAWTLKVRKG